MAAGARVTGHTDANVRKQKDRNGGAQLAQLSLFFPFDSVWNLDPWNDATLHSTWVFHFNVNHFGKTHTDRPRGAPLRLLSILLN